MQDKIDRLVEHLCEDFDKEARGLDTRDAMYLIGGILHEFFIVAVETCVKESHQVDAAEILLAALTRDVLLALKRKESPMDLNITPTVTADEISLAVGGFNQSVFPALTNVGGVITLVVGTGILDSSIELFQGILNALTTIQDEAAASSV